MKVKYGQLIDQFREKFKGLRTGVGVSSLLQYRDEWVFTIDAEKHWKQLDNKNIYLSFGCVGGSVEKDEEVLEALRREAQEEIASAIEVTDSEISYYLDTERNLQDIGIDEETRPVLIFEHHFENPDKGASAYLIFVFRAKAIRQPKPSSEIPAIFMTSLEGFRELADDIPLEQFYENYQLISQTNMPEKGMLGSYMTPRVLLTHCSDKLDELFFK